MTCAKCGCYWPSEGRAMSCPCRTAVGKDCACRQAQIRAELPPLTRKRLRELRTEAQAVQKAYEREGSSLAAYQQDLAILDALERSQEALQEHGKCPQCKGRKSIYKACSYCGDSTYDHYCNDGDIPCRTCNGSGVDPKVAPLLLPEE